jgi:hypothetical protein
LHGAAICSARGDDREAASKIKIYTALHQEIAAFNF